MTGRDPSWFDDLDGITTDDNVTLEAWVHHAIDVLGTVALFAVAIAGCIWFGVAVAS